MHINDKVNWYLHHLASAQNAKDERAVEIDPVYKSVRKWVEESAECIM